ncbi:MAG: hypothetical protein GY937_13250 [bacterium]|nr:hypothetical protein [bacterium]
MTDTLAQKLGFAAGNRIAILHVDDIGMCHAANEGGFAALLEGLRPAEASWSPVPGFAERQSARERIPIWIWESISR